MKRPWWDPAIEELLHDWEPPEADSWVLKHLPQIKRVNDEGNWEFIWTWKEQDEEGTERYAGIERVVFEPERFVYERYEDVMQVYADDAVYDEDGDFIGVYDISYEYNDEPTALFSEWEQEWRHESQGFDRRTLLAFLNDVLSGRLKRDTRQQKSHGGTYSRHFWSQSLGTPAQRARPPRSRAAMAQWIRSMGHEAIASGAGGEDVDYIEFDYKDE
jgi:hypothetical protein